MGMFSNRLTKPLKNQLSQVCMSWPSDTTGHKYRNWFCPLSKLSAHSFALHSFYFNHNWPLSALQRSPTCSISQRFCTEVPSTGSLFPQIFLFRMKPSHNSVLSSNNAFLNRPSSCVPLKSASPKQSISFTIPLFKTLFLLGASCFFFFLILRVHWSCSLIESMRALTVVLVTMWNGFWHLVHSQQIFVESMNDNTQWPYADVAKKEG